MWRRSIHVRASLRYFISYSSMQGVLAEQLQASLDRAGQDVWRDRTALRSSDDWHRRLVEAIPQCDALVVLLCAAAGKSEIVRLEVDTAHRHGLAVHVFADHADFDTARLYASIRDLNVVSVDPFSADPDTAVAQAQRIAYEIVSPDRPTHPVATAADLERVTMQRLLPMVGTGGLDAAITDRYLTFARFSTSRSTMVAANYALLFMQRNRWEEAAATLTAAQPYCSSGLVPFWLSIAQVGRRRAKLVKPPRLREKAIANALAAHRSLVTPLATLNYLVLAWDDQKVRGEGAEKYAREALQALPAVQEPRGEVARYLALSNVGNTPDLPLGGDRIVSTLKAYAGGTP